MSAEQHAHTQVFTDIPTLERIASAAANNAVAQMAKTAITREEVGEIAKTASEEVLNNFIDRVFDLDPKDRKGLSELRKDFTAMRNSRKLKEAMQRHGIRAVVVSLVTAIMGVIWLGIQIKLGKTP